MTGVCGDDISDNSRLPAARIDVVRTTNPNILDSPWLLRQNTGRSACTALTDELSFLSSGTSLTA